MKSALHPGQSEHCEHDHEHDQPGNGDGHGHGQEHDHGDSHQERNDLHSGGRALRNAAVLTALFMGVEFAAGYFSNSLALISDATHMLTDFFALCIGAFAAWVGSLPASRRMTYGYYRVEILCAFVSGLAIWILAGSLIYQAALRVLDPPGVNGPVVAITSIFGLLINIAAMKLLHRHSHSSLNVRAAYFHVIADCLGSVASLISGVVIWFSDWRAIDPLVTFLIAVFLVFSAWQLIRDATSVLLLSTPDEVNTQQVREALLGLDGVKALHDLHLWVVGNRQNALSVHLIAERPAHTLSQAQQMLRDRFKIGHSTIQVEELSTLSSKDRQDCSDCSNEGQ